MQPIGHRRRSWNWQRLLKKARGGTVAVLASLPLLVFVALVYSVMLLERLFSRTEQRSLSARGFTDQSRKASRPAAAGEQQRHSATLDPGLLHQSGLAARNTSPDTEFDDDQRALAEASDRAQQETDRAMASNLALCGSPAAVLVIVEETALRHELNWRMMEAVFARLIDLRTTPGDARLLMRTCGYDWLYEMPIAPRRFIRLRQQGSGDRFRWQHTATRRICFEYDGGPQHLELLPSFDILYSQTRIFFYFDDEDQLVGWERPREARRRHL